MSRSKNIFRGSIAGPLPGYPNSQSCKAPRSSVFCWISFILFFIATRSCAASPPSESLKNALDGIIRRIQNRDQVRNSSTQPPLALPQSTSTIIENSKVNSDLNHNRKFRRNLSQKCDSVKTVSSVQLKANQAKEQIRNILRYTGSTGFYYGIDLERMIPNGSRPKKPRPPKLEDSMALALDELKTLRLEMERMSSEIRQLKRKMIGDDSDESSYYIDDNLSAESKEKALQKRRKEAEKLAAEIESWATAILEEGEEDGWTPVECSKMIRASVNGMERTTAFMKWMVDSRAEKADKEDQTEHPCIKCSSTIDAPLELVCTYLSQPDACPLYNDVVDKFEDLEEISPNAKICWSSSPQILFVKPRDFVTFCHHRWKADGTEVIVNQACEHPKFPLNELEKKGKSCRGYALRGANCEYNEKLYISFGLRPKSFLTIYLHVNNIRFFSSLYQCFV